MFSDKPTVDLDKDDEIIALLAERWPRGFMLAGDRRLPLKVGKLHATRVPHVPRALSHSANLLMVPRMQALMTGRI